jgi:plastocyanin
MRVHAKLPSRFPAVRVLAVCLAVGAGALGLSAPANATFHVQKVDEVLLAGPTGNSAQYVELFDQGGSSETFPPFAEPYGLAIFDAAGHPVGSQALDASKMNSARAAGRPYLVSTPAADASFTVSGDQPLTVPLPASAGQACYTATTGNTPYSCLTWGCISHAVDASAGTGSVSGATPAAGESAQRQPDGSAQPDSVQLAAPTPKAVNSAGRSAAACPSAKPPPFAGIRLMTRRAVVPASRRIRLRFSCSHTAVRVCGGKVTISIGHHRIASAGLKDWKSGASTVVKLRIARLSDHRTRNVRVRMKAHDGAGRTKTTHDKLRLSWAKSKNGFATTAAAARTPGAATTATAHAVAIRNFAFAPSSLAVSVGDTVTWTNRDAADHTATARDGSFDTGTLHLGQSGSITFRHAGTFGYICSVHPFMKGSIVVSAGSSGGGSSPHSGGTGSASGSGSSPAAPPSSSRSAPAPASPSSGHLPYTGSDLLALVGVAWSLLLAGWSARKLAGGRHTGVA